MTITEAIPLLAMLGLTGGELILIAVIALVLFGANRIPPFVTGLNRGIKDFRKASKDVNEALDESARPPMIWPVADALTHTNQTVETDPPPEPNLIDSVIVWFAQGFGIGRVMPTAPGTWGSLLGLGWTGALLDIGDPTVFLLGAVAGAFVSVWLCGQAERILQQKDPPSVVLDEIAAIPFCFLGMIALYAQRHPSQMLPPFSMLLTEGFFTLGLAFGLFRLFDIWKPWPVRQSQSLPGGWGVTVDDLLAALYVNLVILPFLF